MGPSMAFSGAPSTTVGAAARKFALSQTVRRVLRSPHSLDPFAQDRIGVAGFVRGTLCEPALSSKNAYVVDIFGKNAAEILTREAAAKLRSSAPSTLVTSSLWHAFEEAQDLRRQTGGDDEYVGLRYVLFVLLTSHNDAIRKERMRVLALVEVDPGRAAAGIARHCLAARESREKIESWNDIIKSRNIIFFDIDLPIVRAENLTIHIERKYLSKKKKSDDDLRTSPDTVAPHRPLSVPLNSPDDPWAPNVRNATGSGAEARAFADMVTARQFKPPLAVGVFGDWGSGKSFFLRQIHEAIDKRNTSDQTLAADSPVHFCQHVVQIRFNAWHYAETNLWASLVDHIFTSLHDWMSADGKTAQAQTLFDSLTTARTLTIEAAEALVAARKAQEDKRQALRTAETNLQGRRIAAAGDPRSHFLAAFKTLIATPTTKQALKETADRLGLPDLSDNVDAFAKVTRQLDTEIGRLALVRGGVIKELTGRGAAITFVALSGLSPALLGWIASLIAPGAELGASIAGVVASASGALAWATGRSRAALGQIQTYQTRFEAVLATEVATEQAKRDRIAAELATAETEVALATDALRKASDRAAQAAIAYHTETSTSRVLHFVRDRITQGTYTKHLSFIASIRRDFEELTRFLDASWTPSPEAEKAREAQARKVKDLLASAGDLLDADEKNMLGLSKDAPPPDKERMFQRIVLYVDDLDRCRPAQVVAVLEAIQLLLTYPIFVVFVAVDVRWLKTALSDQFASQLSNGAARGTGEANEEQATTIDYLEKIFQIPYWVRPFGATETRTLLDQHIGVQPAPATPRSPPSAAPAGAETPTEPPISGTGQKPGNGTSPGARQPPPPEKRDTAAASSPPDAVHPLALTQAEITALNAVAPFLTPLPRRVVRFLNTYRILKGSLPPVAQHALEEDGHRAVIALLAIGFLAEEAFREVARGFSAQKDAASVDIGFLKQVPGLSPATQDQIQACLTALKNPAPKALAANTDRIARFTFHPGGI